MMITHQSVIVQRIICIPVQLGWHNLTQYALNTR